LIFHLCSLEALAIFHQGTSKAPEAVAYPSISEGIPHVAVHGNCLPSALARQRHQEQNGFRWRQRQFVLLRFFSLVFQWYSPSIHLGISYAFEAVAFRMVTLLPFVSLEIDGSFVRHSSLKAWTVWEGNLCDLSSFRLNGDQSSFHSPFSLEAWTYGKGRISLHTFLFPTYVACYSRFEVS